MPARKPTATRFVVDQNFRDRMHEYAPTFETMMSHEYRFDIDDEYVRRELSFVARVAIARANMLGRERITTEDVIAAAEAAGNDGIFAKIAVQPGNLNHAPFFTHGHEPQAYGIDMSNPASLTLRKLITASADIVAHDCAYAWTRVMDTHR